MLVKCILKVQIDNIYCIIVVRVMCVYDLGKEIEQTCQAAAFVSKEILSHLSGIHSKCVISLPITNLSMDLQSTEVRLMGQ